MARRKNPEDAVIDRRLGEILLRARGSISQDQLAKWVGFDQTAISQWEKGESSMSLATIRKVEEAVGAPRGAFLVAAGLVEPSEDLKAAIIEAARHAEEFRKSLLALIDPEQAEQNLKEQADYFDRSSVIRLVEVPGETSRLAAANTGMDPSKVSRGARKNRPSPEPEPE